MRKQIYEKTKKQLKDIAILWGKADIYLVGGCVRDELLGNPIKDIDLVVDLKDGPNLFCKWLEEKGLAKDFVVYPRFGTSKFTIVIEGKDIPIECVMPRTESYNLGPRKPDSVKYTTIEEDAKRRDFCCNALYRNLRTNEFLDPTEHGIDDIRNKVLRTPLPAKETFIDDPLRMLRAFRFYAEKDFKILPEVFTEIHPYPEYMKLSMERVRDEFCRIMVTSKSIEVIRDLHKTGLLGYIIPELEESWGFNQNSHYHSMNLTDHTFAVLDYAYRNSGGKNLRLYMAALLHDIAKYKCWSKKLDGEFSFHCHEIESSKMAVSIMSRLKFAGDDIKVVEKLVREHMRIKPFYDPLTDMYTGSPAVTRRVVRDLGSELTDCMTLIDADNHSHHPKYNMPGQVKSFWAKCHTLGTMSVVKNCPISGDKIMSELGLNPGPLIGEIKNIFLDWLDENPNLDGDELIGRYKKEFTGKTFWIFSRYSDHSSITQGKPSSEGIPSPYEIPYEIPKIDLGKDIMKEWKAYEHPTLYINFQRYKKSRKIFDEAARVLDKLYDIPGFQRVKIDFDEMHDLSGVIEWKDSKPDYII